MSEKKEKHERFGRYLILDHLVDGGMAKICRARFLGGRTAPADVVIFVKHVQKSHLNVNQACSCLNYFPPSVDEIRVVIPFVHSLQRFIKLKH